MQLDLSSGFHFYYIDGPTLVCADATGDAPLFMTHIDPTGAACQQTFSQTPIQTTPIVTVPTIDTPTLTYVPAVPEAETWICLSAGLAVLLMRRRWLR